MSKILFCGSYIPKEISYKVENNSEAANNFQHEILKHLDKNNDLDILTYVSYKINNEEELKESFKKNRISYVIKSKNYIKTIKSYYIKVLSIIKNKNKDTLILYNLTYINLLIDIVCRIKGIKSVLILADFTDSCEYKSFIRKVLAKITKSRFNKFSHRVVLSSIMYKKLGDVNTLLLQGGINIDKYKGFEVTYPKNNNINILYSGAIEEVTGIDIFLDAISKINNKNINFIISGRGSLVNKVKDAAKEDKRIIYIGFLEELEFLKTLRESHILINPRNMKLDQNNNNFPSKILEYLATGKPIISTKFAGYEIFKEYIEFIDSEAESLANSITQMISDYDYIKNEIFIKNRSYAMNYDWKSQVEKIEEFMSNEKK